MPTLGFGKYDKMSVVCDLCQECEGICYKKNNGDYSPTEPVSLL